MLLKRITWVFSLLLTAGVVFAGPTAEAGKELFNANCAACHAKDMKTNLTGPALAGLEERWAQYPREDLYAWIRNSQGTIAAGQPRAVELWKKYGPVLMNNFPNLTDEQIESMILYINAQAKGGGDDKAKKGAEAPVEEKDSLPWLFIGLALLLGMLAFALMRIVDNLGNVNRVHTGHAPVYKTWKDTVSSKGFVAFLVFASTLIFGYKTVDNATRMQRQQGYQPEQPIKYSHKIHAGDNKIDCQYCHDGARRSKHASIPAANTCMNCHSAVRKGTETGTSEITKIFASVGYDPLTGKYVEGYENWSDDQIKKLYMPWIEQEYKASLSPSPAELDESGRAKVEAEWSAIEKALKNDSNGKIYGPIEWVRIHNLADHAYFNHAQHVSVGKVECQKCHGPIEKMEEVYQYSTLGMGWCINCHRESEVKFEENGFYQQYERYHKELKTKDKDGNPMRKKVTVEDIGGLECQKCHY